MKLNFENTFANELKDFYESSKANNSPSPSLIKFNLELAKDLGSDWLKLDSDEGLSVFSGNTVPNGSRPISQAYSGHQFGGFSPLLGDGRASLLGEVVDKKKIRRDIQLKGSGRTVFSRGGDGKSSLGPVLREYLISESMYSLGIPSTRALAAVSTGEDVFRESNLPGGILTRVASSHIRIGTFQYASTTGDLNKIRALADYSINRHYLKLPEKTLNDLKTKFSFSDYQKSDRDFAFVVDKNFKAQDLIEIISSIDQSLIKSVKIFDVYEGENIPKDKKSIALNVTIQSSEKTLTDNDLEKINNLIIETVENKTGAKIRS